MWGDGAITFDTHPGTSKPALATPLYSYFKKLTRQCEAFMAGASQMLEGVNAQDADEETFGIVQATSLCGDMLAARDDIERAMVVMGKDPQAVANGTPEPAPEEPEANGSSGPGSKAKGKGKGRSKDKPQANDDSGSNKGKARDPDIDMDRAYRLRCEQLAFQYVEMPDVTKPAKVAGFGGRPRAETGVVRDA